MSKDQNGGNREEVPVVGFTEYETLSVNHR